MAAGIDTAGIETGAGLGASAALLAGLRGLPGVRGVVADDSGLDIALAGSADAMPVMAWLAAQGCRLEHFSTAKTNLEDIFLNLTGRSLRD